jgi:voltage-gated potassium channel
MVLLSIAFIVVMTVALPHSFTTIEDGPGVIAVADQVTDGLVEEDLTKIKPGPLERSQDLSMVARLTLVVLALPFWIESLARLVWIERGKQSRAPRRRAAHLIAVALAPPLRATLAPVTMIDWNWLPGLGWRRTTRELARFCQRKLGGPMLLIALLILPVLLIQMLFDDLVQQYQLLALSLDIAIRLIWLAFTVEFLVVLSVTPRKLEYATRHWVDLFIILLPFLAFARTLRLVRLGQLMRTGQMTKLASTYRLRGLALKVMQAILMLRVLETVSGSMAKRRIAKIDETILRRREEIADLEQERLELRMDLAKRLRERRAAKRAKAAGRTKAVSRSVRPEPAVAGA